MFDVYILGIGVLFILNKRVFQLTGFHSDIAISPDINNGQINLYKLR